MDKLFLRGLEVSATIGVYAHEQQNPQLLVLDLEVGVEITQAAATDQLADTLDYATLYQYLLDYIPATRVQLLETLAVNTAKNLMEKFSLPWLRLTITKKPTDMPQISGAGIIIERQHTEGRSIHGNRTQRI